MKNSLVDVPVLLLFFNRKELFKQVFDQVIKARPSVVLLYQDGPRDENDLEGIMKCREIIDVGIDWKCDVYKCYLKENQGCDPSGYRSRAWAFSIVDRCVILEDDCVPSISFFTFCCELLEKYKNDNRISMITGINYEGETACPYDYFFTSDVAIWGWATWKRVFEQQESDYAFMKDEYHMGLMRDYIKERNFRKTFYPMFKWHSNSSVEYFETIHIAYHILNSCLSIVPSKNMIVNIGSISDSTHFKGSFKALSKRDKKVYLLKNNEIKGPLNHPSYCIENIRYKYYIDKMLGRNRPFDLMYRKIVRNLKGLLYKIFDQ